MAIFYKKIVLQYLAYTRVAVMAMLLLLVAGSLILRPLETLAGVVLLYTFGRLSKFFMRLPFLLARRASSPAAFSPPEAITEPTRSRKNTSVEVLRESVENLVLQEARVLARAEYDRIIDVEEMDVAERAKQLADKWWLRDLADVPQRLEAGSTLQKAAAWPRSNLPTWGNEPPNTGAAAGI